MLCQKGLIKLLEPVRHCRYCGWAACGACSSRKRILRRYLEDNKPHTVRERQSAYPLRVCDLCHTHLDSQESDPAEPERDSDATVEASAAADAGVDAPDQDEGKSETQSKSDPEPEPEPEPETQQEPSISEGVPPQPQEPVLGGST